jgi:hypothetical protein
MNQENLTVRGVSDTAPWVAYFRARETQRPGCGEAFSELDYRSSGTGQLRLMQRATEEQLSEAGAAFKFEAAEGVNFFAPHDGEAKDVQGMLKTAAQFQTSAG